MGLAQIVDDFSDGNLSVDPPWFGSVDDFTVNSNYQLQLTSDAAGTSSLLTEISSPLQAGIEWNVFIRQSFSPSGSNYGRIYLTSDGPDLSSPLNGYYLQLGEAGSNDAVELFRQSGTVVTSVCRASSAAIANSFGIRIKVIRNDPGYWQLFIDYAGGDNLTLEATGHDATHPIAGFFGFRCTYTITNAARFFFDDVSMKSFALPDVTPPEILSLEITSESSLRLVFSESLHASSLEGQNFFAAPAGGHPLEIVPGEETRSLLLRFAEPFHNGGNSRLNIANVSDLAGNSMTTTEVEFLFFEESPVSFRDVIVTEIMADPSPEQGLPEAEFLELYNRSSNPVDLSGWVLADESVTATMGRFILLPDTYVIVTSPGASDDYSHLGKTISLANFPALNNSGDAITLKDDHNVLIDSLRYDLSWYRDDEKANGGWSLEMIDVNNDCEDKHNWSSSEAIEGGTPGTRNSISASLPDNLGPAIISVAPLDSVTLMISFDDKLANHIPDVDDFAIQPHLVISSIGFADRSLTRLIIKLTTFIESGTLYTVAINDLYDCAGNPISETGRSSLFILPQKAGRGDIIVNEILFNPRPTGTDFVEIYNRSDKAIDLKNWSLRNHLSSSASVSLTQDHHILWPGEYRVFTENANVLKGEYLAGIEENFYQTKLPALNDDEGTLALVRDDGMVVDSLHYREEMQNPFLKDDEGVSLERIAMALDLESSDPSNWRSASSITGFATPGYLNSNARPDFNVAEGSVSVDPEIIQFQVPNHDFTTIKYRFRIGGWIANVKIYDQQGRPVRQIAANELLGTEGFFRWEGEQDSGGAAGRGYYLILFEVFTVDGLVNTFRKRIAVF